MREKNFPIGNLSYSHIPQFPKIFNRIDFSIYISYKSFEIFCPLGVIGSYWIDRWMMNLIIIIEMCLNGRTSLFYFVWGKSSLCDSLSLSLINNILIISYFTFFICSKIIITPCKKHIYKF